jgi:hypothetical protein
MCQTGPPLCIFLVGVNHEFLHTGFHSRVDPIDHFIRWFHCQLMRKMAVWGGACPKDMVPQASRFVRGKEFYEFCPQHLIYGL